MLNICVANVCEPLPSVTLAAITSALLTVCQPCTIEGKKIIGDVYDFSIYYKIIHIWL